MNVYVPFAVGVPDRTPPEDRLNPGGRLFPVAETVLQVIVAVPVAARVWEYAAPAAPAASDAVVIFGAEPAGELNEPAFVP